MPNRLCLLLIVIDQCQHLVTGGPESVFLISGQKTHPSDGESGTQAGTVW